MFIATIRLAMLSLLLTLAPLSLADTKIIHAGQLLTVAGAGVVANHTIVVEDERIVAVREGFAEASEFAGDVTVIDLRDQFVLPGLMDMHVHLQGEMGPENEKEELQMSPQLMQMRSIMYGMRTLRAGFTTVRDVGSSSQEMYALRDAINNGWIDGPRIIAAGGVAITGGHADVSGMKPDLMERFTSPNVWLKQALPRRSAVLVTATIMHWPKRSTVYTRPK